MFHSARIKLTLWYTFIIMAISILFSVAIYRVLTTEITRSLRIQRYRLEHPNIFFNSPPSFIVPTDPDIVREISQRISFNLLFINLGILVVSATSGYFLSGRTLKPIEDMVEDQKRFIADASHELRTPLTSIKTETEVALRDKSLDLKTAKKLLESNLEEADKMQSLSNYLLTLSQYQNSNLDLSLEKLSIKEVIENAKEKVTSQAKKNNIDIAITGADIQIKANKISLIELFSIFLDNAIKYSLPKSDVTVRLSIEGKNAVIKIEDNGIGIKAGDIPYIFNRFYRADLSRNKAQIDGYGLGLSIAKSIIDFYNGNISVVSHPGKGSTFTITLPLNH